MKGSFDSQFERVQSIVAEKTQRQDQEAECEQEVEWGQGTSKPTLIGLHPSTKLHLLNVPQPFQTALLAGN